MKKRKMKPNIPLRLGIQQLQSPLVDRPRNTGLSNHRHPRRPHIVVMPPSQAPSPTYDNVVFGQPSSKTMANNYAYIAT